MAVHAVFQPCGCRKRAHKVYEQGQFVGYGVRLPDVVLCEGAQGGVRCPRCDEVIWRVQYEHPPKEAAEC